ncbi:MAG: enoyl-CoA hydratase-related protein [Acidimicrobiales bacterium]|jgi:enoyl-CoA hydratase/carnithine racemase|nr:enoyl-CoA hydratase-related protein [Acidimicrobiales bacterium]
MSDEQHERECTYEVDDHVATITLNRPHRRNAITFTMLEQLTEALLAADGDPQVRAVILTGAGKGFCSGLDLKEAMGGSGIGSQGSFSGGLPHTRDIPTTVLFEMDTPIIAAVNGAAAGYGIDLALGCDMRIGGTSTRLLPGFAKRGVVPESGGTWYLPRLLGWAKAAEISFRGNDLDAVEAERIGLLNTVVSDDELLPTARRWAAEIAANAPLAVQSMKRLFRHGLSEDFVSHTHHVLLQTVRLMQTADFREAVASFLEQREPTFEGR